MILSDKDILSCIKNGTIVIKPFDKETQLQPSSVDLKLSPDFLLFRHSEKPFIDPKNDSSLEDYTELIKVRKNGCFIIHPGEFVLGSTLEHIKLPNDLVARLDGRSSIGRLGVVVHSTAGYIDPGFYGKVTLEIANLGKVPVALYPGMRICQVSFQHMSSPAEVPYDKKKDAKYLGKDTPVASKVYKDKELE